MPNKKVDNLKDETSRKAGKMWQKELKLKDLTTREWNSAADMMANGKNMVEIRKEIQKMRKK